MKKIIFLVIISITPLFLYGCSKVDSNELNLSDDTVLEINDFNVKTASQNQPEEILLKGSNHPRDVRVFNNKLYLLEKEPNVIKRYDFDGNLEEIYELGEKIDPSLFTMNDEYIFVYDSLGNKISIMNHQFIEINEIMLEKLQFNANYVDIEEYNDTIYMTVNTAEISDAVIYSYDFSGNTERIENEFNGYLSKSDESLYFCKSLEYVSKEEISGFVSGENKLYELFPKKEEKIRFPSGYTPGDFVINFNQKNSYFVFSMALHTLDVWNDGNYIHTLLELTDKSITEAKLSLNSEYLFALFPEKSVLYKVKIN